MPVSSERIAAILEMVKGPRVLHVGCVGGKLPDTAAARDAWVHGALVDAGYNVVGGDIQHDAIAEMQRMGLEATYLDAQAIPPDGERYDTVFAGELIEHLENPGLFLRGVRSRLNPHGRLVLTTPNVWSPYYWLHFLKRRHRSFNREHTVWFDRQVLTQMLDRCGFRVVTVRYIDDLYPELAESRWVSAYTAVWRRLRRVVPECFRNDLVVVAEPLTTHP